MKWIIDMLTRKTMLRTVAMTLAVILLATTITPSLEKVFAEGEDQLARIYAMLSNTLENPETSEDYYELANIAIGRQEYETALEHLEKARELADPKNKVAVAEMWLKTGSVQALLEDFESAMTSLNTALENDPTSAQTLLLRSQLHLSQGNLVPSACDMELYMKLVPNDVNTGATLAQLYEQMMKYDEAKAQYEAMAQLQPDNPAYRLNALRCTFLNGEYDAALEGFDDFMAQKKEENAEYRAVAAFLRAACLMQMERYPEAVEGFESAIEEGYAEATCREQMLLCHFENDDFAAVIECGSDMIEKELQPAAADVFYQRMGAARMQLQQYEEALQELDKAMELNPELLGTSYYRGVTLLALERMEEAIEAFTQSIEQGFLPQFCYYNRGVCNIRLLEYDKALEDFGMTLTSGEDESLIQAAKDTLWQLAQYYENQSTATAK